MSESHQENQKKRERLRGGLTAAYQTVRAGAAKGWNRARAAGAKVWNKSRAMAVKAWEKTRPTAARIWSKTRVLAVRGWNKSRAVAAKAWSSAGAMAVKVWEKTRPTAARIWSKTRVLTARGWNKTCAAGAKVWSSAGAMAVKVREKARPAAARLWSKTRVLAIRGWNKSRAAGAKAWGRAGVMAVKVREKARPAAARLWSKTRVLAARGWNKTCAAGAKVWSRAVPMAVKVREKARPVAARLWSKTRVLAARGWNKTCAAGAKVWSRAVPMAVKAREKARPAANRVWSKTRTMTSEAWNRTRTAGVKALSQSGLLGKAWTKAAGGWRKSLEAADRVRSAVSRHPVSPLLYVALLAVGIGVVAFRGTYTLAYTVRVDGVELGVVATEDDAAALLQNVETRVSSILGEDYDYDAKVTLTPVYTANASLSDVSAMEDILFENAGALVEAYAISVDDRELGYAPATEDLEELLDRVAEPYMRADAVSYDFLEQVEIYPVEMPSNTEYNLEELYAALTASTVEEARYTVEKGDTFNQIAYSLDMAPADLSELNQGVNINVLYVGQELVIQKAVPVLSVRVHTNQSYEETLESPVEYIETDSLYIGTTSVKEQGEEGLARINADVIYVNGYETERTINSSETLREPTTTYVYTGTTPRPVTASNGYYTWPVRGSITSGYGGRYLFGAYDFHLGIDIACAHGTAIRAADGGTVTRAGWSGSYGYLVVITHDNGSQTYYAHNSSLLVSVGDKVYQGQTIARAGSTGNSTGTHCHFEIRINGQTVNPLNYL